MSSPTVFYSWQSDLPATATRDVIATSLSRSVDALASHPRIIDSPRLDQDTQNVGGTPEIVATIFRKIDRAAVFVADVSISSQTTDTCPNRKYSPNVNVMLETGYAAARLGWDRIVLVMNDRFGGPTKLPFDLRNRRWPITFSATKPTIESGLDELVTRFNEQTDGGAYLQGSPYAITPQWPTRPFAVHDGRETHDVGGELASQEG